MTGPTGKFAPPACSSIQAIHSGVMMTPTRLDRVALNTATGTLPRAATVSATDDDTVEGRAHR